MTAYKLLSPLWPQELKSANSKRNNCYDIYIFYYIKLEVYLISANNLSKWRS